MISKYPTIDEPPKMALIYLFIERGQDLLHNVQKF